MKQIYVSSESNCIITNYMEQGPWKANSRLADLHISLLLWNLTIHYLVHYINHYQHTEYILWKKSKKNVSSKTESLKWLSARKLVFDSKQ